MELGVMHQPDGSAEELEDEASEEQPLTSSVPI